MSSGVNRVKTGAVDGTGANIDVDTVGFRPASVELINSDGDCFAKWTRTMDDATAMKTIAAGTTAQITSLGVTPRAAGFRIGADTDLNVAGERIHWEAREGHDYP